MFIITLSSLAWMNLPLAPIGSVLQRSVRQFYHRKASIKQKLVQPVERKTVSASKQNEPLKNDSVRNKSTRHLVQPLKSLQTTFLDMETHSTMIVMRELEPISAIQKRR
ncbi:hypothetical protein DFJ43DRAFT_1075381 [Lentinula guzmanii]|uniref:Uncharacterized protein n=1 Tax=Lentinula guzmanii TaxID=2804957 RepID=A0AA38N111_9AGAR|nr:hypothetical protein DFJ43DRAFT_1075381 [Lentinula guzmanii]